jgi:hypothetical protein
VSAIFHLASCTSTKYHTLQIILQLCSVTLMYSDIPSSKSHAHFPLFRFSKNINPNSRFYVTFLNLLIFCSKMMFCPRTSSKMEDQPCSAVRSNLFTAAWRPSAPTPTWEIIRWSLQIHVYYQAGDMTMSTEGVATSTAGAGMYVYIRLYMYIMFHYMCTLSLYIYIYNILYIYINIDL